jgi:hypothetical protein
VKKRKIEDVRKSGDCEERKENSEFICLLHYWNAAWLKRRTSLS